MNDPDRTGDPRSERDRFLYGREIPREPEVPDLSTADIERIGEAVFQPSDPQPADLILVLGTSTGRWDLVAELYHRDLAPMVVTTGRRGIAYFDTGRPLAELIRDALVEHGVPAEAILASARSDHTGEDVRFGLEDAARAGMPARSVLFACKEHHAGRVRATFARWAPGLPTSCFTYPVDYDGVPVRAEDWWQHPKSAARVYGEYLRIQKFFGPGTATA